MNRKKLKTCLWIGSHGAYQARCGYITIGDSDHPIGKCPGCMKEIIVKEYMEPEIDEKH